MLQKIKNHLVLLVTDYTFKE